jgi:hypothetical protein
VFDKVCVCNCVEEVGVDCVIEVGVHVVVEPILVQLLGLGVLGLEVCLVGLTISSGGLGGSHSRCACAVFWRSILEVPFQYFQ